jgi:hypothetical protein
MASATFGKLVDLFKAIINPGLLKDICEIDTGETTAVTTPAPPAPPAPPPALVTALTSSPAAGHGPPPAPVTALTSSPAVGHGHGPPPAAGHGPNPVPVQVVQRVATVREINNQLELVSHFGITMHDITEYIKKILMRSPNEYKNSN